MEDTLVGHEVAKLAKEKGFNERVIHYYTPEGHCNESEGYMTERLVESNWNNGEGNYPTMPEDVSCSAPTQSLLQKWLREKHNIDVYCIPCETQLGDITLWKSNDTFVGKYEEALEVGLIEGLKEIKLL